MEEKRKMAAGRERKNRWAEERKTFPSEQFRKEKPLWALWRTASRTEGVDNEKDQHLVPREVGRRAGENDSRSDSKKTKNRCKTSLLSPSIPSQSSLVPSTTSLQRSLASFSSTSQGKRCESR